MERPAYVAVWAGLLAIVISSLAGGVWTALLVANLATGPSIPWAVPVMAVILWLGWRSLAGDGPPRRTSAARRKLLRATPVSRAVLAWSIVAGTCAVVALAGLWILGFAFVAMPANALPDTSGYPFLTSAAFVVMGSLVSPLSEEAGFRGYAQSLLERRFALPVAVAISSFWFVVPHLPVAGPYWPKLLVYFLAGVTFGTIAGLTGSILASIPVHIIGDVTFFVFVWPYDATRRLVSETGIDAMLWIHVAQVVVFAAIALLAFRRLARAVRAERSARPL